MKKIMKRFLILFLCFSLLGGIYTKKANAIAIADDIIIIGGLAIGATAITGLVINTLHNSDVSFVSSSDNSVSNISNTLRQSVNVSSYLTVKILDNGSKFLTWTSSGIDWLTEQFSFLSGSSSSDVDNDFSISVNLSDLDLGEKIRLYNIKALKSSNISYSFYSYKNGIKKYYSSNGTTLSLSSGKTYEIGFSNYQGHLEFYMDSQYRLLDYCSKIDGFSISGDYVIVPFSDDSASKVDSKVIEYNFYYPQKDNPNEPDKEKPKIGIPILPKEDDIPSSVPEEMPYFEPSKMPSTDTDVIVVPDDFVIPDSDSNPTPDPDPNPTPDPDPNPTPDPDPNPDTGNDEDKLPDNDTPVLDFSPLYGATRKFPFCLPWDIYDCIKVFKSEEEPLKYEFKETKYSDTEIIIIPHFEIDFSKIPHINILRNVLKLFLYYQFIRFLMISIRKVMWS